MKLAAKFFTGIILLVLGIVVGYSVGYKHSIERRIYLEDLELAHYEAFAKVQSDVGSIESREEALHQFIALTEKRTFSDSPLFTEKTYGVDMALSYARLSILAKQKGNEQQAAAYLNQAASYCPQIGWGECNTEIILSVTKAANASNKNR